MYVCVYCACVCACVCICVCKYLHTCVHEKIRGNIWRLPQLLSTLGSEPGSLTEPGACNLAR